MRLLLDTCALIAFRTRLYNLETMQRIDALHSSPPLQLAAASLRR